MEVAKRLAEAEYDKFHARRLIDEAASEIEADIDELRKRIQPGDESQQEDTE